MRTMKLRALLLATAAAASIAISAVQATTASAADFVGTAFPVACAVTDSRSLPCQSAVPATYKGWAHVANGCGISYENGYRIAWRWTGSTWARAYVWNGAQVYVWPYGGGWSWIWTQQTGWLALQSNVLLVNPLGNCMLGVTGAAGTRVP